MLIQTQSNKNFDYDQHDKVEGADRKNAYVDETNFLWSCVDRWSIQTLIQPVFLLLKLHPKLNHVCHLKQTKNTPCKASHWIELISYQTILIAICLVLVVLEPVDWTDSSENKNYSAR